MCNVIDLGAFLHSPHPVSESGEGYYPNHLTMEMAFAQRFRISEKNRFVCHVCVCRYDMDLERDSNVDEISFKRAITRALDLDHHILILSISPLSPVRSLELLNEVGLEYPGINAPLLNHPKYQILQTQLWGSVFTEYYSQNSTLLEGMMSIGLNEPNNDVWNEMVERVTERTLESPYFGYAADFLYTVGNGYQVDAIRLVANAAQSIVDQGTYGPNEIDQMTGLELKNAMRKQDFWGATGTRVKLATLLL